IPRRHHSQSLWLSAQGQFFRGRRSCDFHRAHGQFRRRHGTVLAMTAAATSTRGLAALALLWWLAATALAWAQAPVPPLTGRVGNATGTVPAEREQRLAQQLARLEGDTGAQMAVLTVATTEGEAIEAYAGRVFEAWKFGRQGIDDGVLLVV